MRFVRLALATSLLLIIGGCVVPPAPYPAYGYGYGYGYPGYYGPAFVAGPTIATGGGWEREHWR